ncbi:hypothetical protein ACQ4PT_020859 [Festuca glaucescens]
MVGREGQGSRRSELQKRERWQREEEQESAWQEEQERESREAAAAMAAKEKEGESGKFWTSGIRKYFPVRIPASFNQYLQNQPTGVVYLKGQSGNTWLAELASDNKGLFFVKGWKEFVRDHSIETGHFLTFCYDGRSRFSVVIFDKMCVEKPSAFYAKPCKDRAVKLETSERDIDINVAGPSEVMASPLEMIVVPLEESNRTTRNRIREMDANRSALQKLCIASDKGKNKCPGASVCTHKSGSTGLNSTEDSDSSRSMLEQSISCIKSELSSAMRLKMNKNVARRGKNRVTGGRQLKVISQRPAVTEEQKNQALQRAKQFKSKSPFGLHIMKESYVYVGFFMKISCEFVREYFPHASRNFKLWDPQGKSWDVKYVYYSERSVGAFSAGWGKFAVGNNLEKFDVCIFELFGEDNIKVHIYRVVPEITPFLPGPGRK